MQRSSQPEKLRHRREVNFLQKVAAMVRVRLVGTGQAFERRAVSGGCFAVPVVLRSFHS